MPRMHIRSHNRIELKHSIAMLFSLNQAILYQLLPDMQATGIPGNCIARIANMSTAPNIVGMQNIQSINLSGFQLISISFILESIFRLLIFDIHWIRNDFCHSAICLLCKELSSTCLVQQLFLWKGNSILYHFIPDADHLRKILLLIFSYFNLHYLISPHMNQTSI